jgi:AbrB family looped-hinge helix DNA binding protein
MPVATLTSKGQTTIPRDVRRHLGLKPGDKLRFVLDDDGRVVIVAATLPVAALRGVLPAPPKAVTVAEMRAAVRKRAANR